MYSSELLYMLLSYTGMCIYIYIYICVCVYVNVYMCVNVCFFSAY